MSIAFANLRFAIIGCGAIAKRHAKHIHEQGNLVAVADTDLSKAQQLAASYKCNYYNSIEELLNSEKQIDVIVICTPNGLHAKHSVLALQHGCNVLCEKPMAIKSSDCLAMINAAKEAGKHLFVVKQNRYNPPVVAVKKLIDENRIGKILNAQLNCFWNRDASYYNSSTWKGSLNLDGGILFTQFSHFIDLLIWMLGDVETVQAMSKNYKHDTNTEFADTIIGSLKFSNGVLATIHCTTNAFNKNMEGSITFFGENGTVKIGGEYLNTLEYQNIDGYKIEELEKGNTANQYGSYTGSMSNHDKVYKNVIDVLLSNEEPHVNMYEGYKTVELIEKIHLACNI